MCSRSLYTLTGEKLTPVQLGIAGGFAGILTTSIMAPGERIKCILQVQQAATGPPKYSGPIHVIKVKHIKN
jgi:solute carrier family 25 carnitine/acylcarnitine transporter 20/29